MRTQHYWLLKTEPSTYSWSDLATDGETVWDGVRNAQALIHIRAMAPGDLALIYHSGDERSIVGLAEIASAPYPDPEQADQRRTVVKVRARTAVTTPVALRTLKADPQFALLGLVRQPRLSVMPVPAELWTPLLVLCGLT